MSYFKIPNNGVRSNINFFTHHQKPVIHAKKTIRRYKSNQFVINSQQNSIKYIKSLKKRSKNFNLIKGNHQLSQSIFQFIDRICNQLHFTVQTLALAIYFYLHFRKKVSHFIQDCFYGSVCLIIAAKIIEIDKKIPYYSKYKIYACKNYTSLDYKKAQREIIQNFQFKLQIPTCVSFLHFYLANGIIFSDQNFDIAKIPLVQQKSKELLHKYIKNGKFMSQNPEKMASKIIYEARKQFNLNWHQMLQQQTEYSANMLQQPSKHILRTLFPRAQKGSKKFLDFSYINGETKKQKDEYEQNKGHKRFVVMKTKLNPLKSVHSHSVLNIISFKKIEQKE